MTARRALRWTAPVVALVAMSSLSGCVSLSACPAVGYAYGGPAVIQFDPKLPAGATVAACFGEECGPAPVSITADGVWEVPQETPYIPADTIPAGEIRALRVVATAPDGTATDDTYEIPIKMEPEGVFGQRPGPFTFEPVVVEG